MCMLLLLVLLFIVSHCPQGSASASSHSAGSGSAGSSSAAGLFGGKGQGKQLPLYEDCPPPPTGSRQAGR